MSRLVPFQEKVGVRCPVGTLKRVHAAAIACQKTPTEMLREAVMAIARQGDFALASKEPA
jgi:hypothetical protein